MPNASGKPTRFEKHCRGLIQLAMDSSAACREANDIWFLTKGVPETPEDEREYERAHRNHAKAKRKFQEACAKIGEFAYEEAATRRMFPDLYSTL